MSADTMAAGQGSPQRQPPLISQGRAFHDHQFNETRSVPCSVKRHRRYQHPLTRPARVEPSRYYPPQAKRQAVRGFEAYVPSDWTEALPAQLPPMHDTDRRVRHQREAACGVEMPSPHPTRMFREPSASFAPRRMEPLRHGVFPLGDEVSDQRRHFSSAATPPPREDWRNARGPYDAGNFAVLQQDRPNPVVRDDPRHHIRRQDPVTRDHGLSNSWTRESASRRHPLTGSSSIARPQHRQDEDVPQWPTEQRMVATRASHPVPLSNDRRLSALAAVPPLQGPVHVHFGPVEQHINVHVHPQRSDTQDRRRRAVSHLLKRIGDLMNDNPSP